MSTLYSLACMTVVMHEDLTSYDCIIIIFTAILYSPIKVKNYNQLPLILLSSDKNTEHHHQSHHPHHHNDIDRLGIVSICLCMRWACS